MVTPQVRKVLGRALQLMAHYPMRVRLQLNAIPAGGLQPPSWGLKAGSPRWPPHEAWVLTTSSLDWLPPEDMEADLQASSSPSHFTLGWVKDKAAGHFLDSPSHQEG